MSHTETIRDEFAGKAMQALIGKYLKETDATTPHVDRDKIRSIAELSYTFADAMLNAKNKQP